MPLQQLYASLERLHGLFSELIDLGLSKKDHIANDRIDDLTQVLAKESKCLKGLEEANKSYVAALAALQRELGFTANSSMSLAEIAKALTKPDDKRTVASWMQKLTAQTNELKFLNETNQLLVRQALEFAELSLDLLMNTPEEVVYQAPTQSAQPSYGYNRKFDLKA